MTTDHDLLAKINEIASNTTTDSWNIEVLYPHSYEPLIKALRAVVERTERDASDLSDPLTYRWQEGYNQCLADIKADITKALLEKAGE